MHGNVCGKCWGYRKNCNKTRIGHCVEALDKYISGEIKDKLIVRLANHRLKLTAHLAKFVSARSLA